MKMKLDFSEFHPLDHYPWEQRCRGFFGGPRQHLRIWWEFKGRFDLLCPILSRTTCKIGRHKMYPYWSTKDLTHDGPPDMKTDPPSGYACMWCPRSTKNDPTTKGST